MGRKLQKKEKVKTVKLSFNQDEMRILDIALFLLRHDSNKNAPQSLGFDKEEMIKVANKIEKHFDKIRGIKHERINK